MDPVQGRALIPLLMTRMASDWFLPHHLVRSHCRKLRRFAVIRQQTLWGTDVELTCLHTDLQVLASTFPTARGIGGPHNSHGFVPLAPQLTIPSKLRTAAMQSLRTGIEHKPLGSNDEQLGSLQQPDAASYWPIHPSVSVRPGSLLPPQARAGIPPDRPSSAATARRLC
jgi:hypothetical protein